MIPRAFLDGLGVGDLLEPARANTPFARRDLERLLRLRNPLAVAGLADARREAVSGVTVTHPWTLRIRAPGLPAPHEDRTRVSHEVTSVAGIVATEMQMLGTLPADAPLAQAVELVRSLVAARPELSLRAFAAQDVAALAGRERTSFRAVLETLKSAGVATLDWRPGADHGADSLRVHRTAHEIGLRTVAPLGYGHGGIGPELLDRLQALREVAESTHGFLSLVVLPDRTEGESPLTGTAGTDDITACALARLALGDVIPHVTVDAHVVGHKLGAILLSAGADDFVGAQAALRWAPPSNDGPRPLNPDRVRACVIEARRSPALRDALFRGANVARPES